MTYYNQCFADSFFLSKNILMDFKKFFPKSAGEIPLLFDCAFYKILIEFHKEVSDCPESIGYLWIFLHLQKT